MGIRINNNIGDNPSTWEAVTNTVFVRLLRNCTTAILKAHPARQISSRESVEGSVKGAEKSPSLSPQSQ